VVTRISAKNPSSQKQFFKKISRRCLVYRPAARKRKVRYE